MRVGITQVASEEDHGVIEEQLSSFLLCLEFVHQAVEDPELLGFDKSKLCDLVRLLTVMREVVVIDGDARDRRHGIGTLKEDSIAWSPSARLTESDRTTAACGQ